MTQQERGYYYDSKITVEIVSTKGPCSKEGFQKFSFSIGNISELSIHVQAKMWQAFQSLKTITCNSTEVHYWLKLRQSCACSSRQWTEFWVRKLVDFPNSVAEPFLNRITTIISEGQLVQKSYNDVWRFCVNRLDCWCEFILFRTAKKARFNWFLRWLVIMYVLLACYKKPHFQAKPNCFSKIWYNEQDEPGAFYVNATTADNLWNWNSVTERWTLSFSITGFHASRRILSENLYFSWHSTFLNAAHA